MTSPSQVRDFSSVPEAFKVFLIALAYSAAIVAVSIVGITLWFRSWNV